MVRVRRFLAAACVLVLLTGVAAPAYSSSEASRMVMGGSDPVSPVVDVLLLRPVAMVTLIGGTAIFVASVPFIAITRPHEIGKPFDALVAKPARYIWMDPLGSH